MTPIEIAVAAQLIAGLIAIVGVVVGIVVSIWQLKLQKTEVSNQNKTIIALLTEIRDSVRK